MVTLVFFKFQNVPCIVKFAGSLWVAYQPDQHGKYYVKNILHYFRESQRMRLYFACGVFFIAVW